MVDGTAYDKVYSHGKVYGYVYGKVYGKGYRYIYGKVYIVR